MKILMLTDRMDAGGAETHVASLALTLSRAGEEVTLFSSGGRQADALEREGIRTLRTPPFSRSPLRLFRILLRLVRLLRREKFDVLHAHARLPALLLRALPRGLRPATVVTVHAKFSVTPFSRRLSYWGDHTVAVSEDLRIYAADAYGLPYGRIRVIPNGIDLEKFSPERRSIPSDGSVRILFASRLDKDCVLGARLLCQVLPRLSRRFPTLSLTVAGGGSAYEEIAALAAHCNRVARRRVVTLVGHVEEMPDLYASHEIFVGVSRAAMEAAACGCAVLLLGDEGYLGILGGEALDAAWETNLTCRGARRPTAGALERDLLTLLRDVSARERIAREGCAWVREHFNVEDTAKKTLALYRAAHSSPQTPSLLIGGYFSCGNLGDDVILAGTREALSTLAPDVRLTALTGKGARDRGRLGIPCVRRRAPLAVRRAMRRADVFLCGGGSLLQNKTSNRSLSYYLALLRTAKKEGCAPVLYAAGIGPLHGTRARERVRDTLALCARISLRDPASLALLRDCGVTAPLFLGADPALLYPVPSRAFLRSRLEKYGLSRVSYCCVALKGGCERSPALQALLEELSRTRDIRPVFLILDRVADRAASVSLARPLHAPVLTPDPDTLLALLAHARLVLCERLHAMILSSSVATPAVGLLSDAADPKIAAFAAISGQCVCNACDAGALFRCAHELLTESTALLRAHVATLRKKAKKDLENILEMLYNIDSTH